MHCWGCRLEFDEINESQPVCPGCGQVPTIRRDHSTFSAIVEELPPLASPPESQLAEDDNYDSNPVLAANPLPMDLQEAADDAEALLEATGLAAFRLTGGFRLFRLRTEWVI